MKIIKLTILVAFLLSSIGCGNKKFIKNTNDIEFRQLFAIESFDSAIVEFDKEHMYDLSPIKEAINNAKQSSEKMIWKGAYRVTFTNTIAMDISFYGSFFSECSTGKVFIVSEEYSEKFKLFVKNMLIHSSEIVPTSGK